MATRYNKRHNAEIFEVGDIISVGIPREDRAKTNNKRLYCRIIVEAAFRVPSSTAIKTRHSNRPLSKQNHCNEHLQMSEHDFFLSSTPKDINHQEKITLSKWQHA